MNDEFYIGWEDKAPPQAGRRMRGIVFTLLALVIVSSVLLAMTQKTIGAAVFEWGKVKNFSGAFRSEPYPQLLVPRPRGMDGEAAAFSTYHLVKPFKFGLDADSTRRYDGHTVRLKGTLIYRGDQTMIEVANGSIEVIEAAASQPALASPSPKSLGRHTLVGEIVDSKCYFGVMNPGSLTPHRACAIRCISGGIPPVLLVRQTNGAALCFLLVSPEGKPVNKQVLDLVAEPVEITGDVERQGELLILRAAPSTYRRHRSHGVSP